MIITTKAIVLNTIKFQDSSLIVKCYTQNGIKSYLIKGVFSKSKKAKLKLAHFQLLTFLDLIANHNNKGKLNYIKEATVYQHTHQINTNIYKSTIAIFLAEILTSVLQEEEENIALYNYLEHAFNWLENNKNIANFHLLFLLNLTKYLGFYPKKIKNAQFFNLKEGIFTINKPISNYSDTSNFNILKSVIGIDFDAISNLQINAKERQQFLLFLITYFALHLPEFRKPKSLAVLQSVFK